ncbi:MAG: PAS domain S-box protein [Dethiobacter sp.]|nr:PAS domain S-box protein [Dethiobacter sp.]
MERPTKISQDLEASYQTALETISELRQELESVRAVADSLRRSEEKYRVMFEHAGTAMLVIEEDGTISMANREMERLSGYNAGEILHQRWGNFVSPEDLRRMMKYRIRRTDEQSWRDPYEFALIRRDGVIRNIIYIIGVIPGTNQVVGSMTDITEQKQTERSLLEALDKFHTLIETIEDGFFEVDIKGNFKTVNEALCKALGYKKEELLGNNFKLIANSENLKKVYKAFNKVHKSGRHEPGFVWEYLRKDGSAGVAEGSVSLFRNGSGEVTGFCGIARDVTERVKIEEKLKYLSMHDSLTGLYNRAYFEEEIERISGSRFLPVCIITMDINDLKVVNDTKGHKKGDELIIATADIIKKSFRPSDVVARLGGDEFAVVLPNTDDKTANSAVKRVREALQEYNQGEREVSVSFAIGWATRKTEQESLMETYQRADTAMYRDKKRLKRKLRQLQVNPKNY